MLQIYTIENTGFRIGWDAARARYSRSLRDGHFSLKAFLQRDAWNVFSAYVQGDNLLTREDLPDADIVINVVSCPDLNPGALKAVDRFLNYRGITNVINDPKKVLRTTREENAQRLGAIDGVLFPRTELFRNDRNGANVVRRLELLGYEFPILVRAPGTQTGVTMMKLDSPEEAARHLERLPRGTALYAIQYIDLLDAEGFYHKMRCFFIDRQFYPIANLTNDEWQIHSGDRYRVMDKSDASQAEEQRYLNDPEGYLGPAVLNSLHAIRDTIDLDFFGIDFTVMPDGQVMIFEANAAMRHNFDHADNFPYTRPHLERASAAFQTMLERRLSD